MQNVDVPQILQIMVKNNAADVFFYTGARISMKTANGFAQMGEALQPGVTDKIVRELLSDDKTKEFEATGETDFSLSFRGIGRFRGNAFRQRGSLTGVAPHQHRCTEHRST